MRIVRCAIALFCVWGSVAALSSCRSATDRARRDEFFAMSAHVVVLKSQLNFAEYRDVMRTARSIDGVVATSPFVFLETQISSAGKADHPCGLKGIDPRGRVLELGRFMKAGAIEDLAHDVPPAIILGDALADVLHVHVGDRVTVTMSPTWSTTGEPSQRHEFRVAGLFHTSLDFTQNLAITSLAGAQQIAQRGDEVMGIEIIVEDPDEAAKVAHAIEHALGGPPYEVRDWFDSKRGMFAGRSP